MPTFTNRCTVHWSYGDDFVTLRVIPAPPNAATLTFPLSRPFGDLWRGLERWQVAMQARHQLSYTFDRQNLYNQFHRAQRQHMMWLNRRQAEVAFRHQEYNRGVVVPRTAPVDYVDPWELKRRAETRARELLARLNPDLEAKVAKGGAFYLKGQQFWFIVNADTKAVTVLFADRPRSLCIYIRDRNVQENKWDWAIAMWMHIKSNESSFLKTANHFEWRPETVQEALPRVELDIGPIRGQQADVVIYDDIEDDTPNRPEFR